MATLPSIEETQATATAQQKQLATLINPQNLNDKKVVEAGSQEAQQFFGQGYKLMGADGKPVADTAPATPVTLVTPAPVTPTTPTTPTTPATPTTGAIPLTPEEQSAKYADAMKSVVSSGANAGKDFLFSTAGQSFDNQLLVQRGILFAQLAGERLTPEDLRVLSPQQQELIRSGDKAALQSHIVGLNSIMDGRKTLRKEEEDRALQQFDLFMRSGTPVDRLPTEFLERLDQASGLPSGTYANIYKADFAVVEAERQKALAETADAFQDKLLGSQIGESVTIAGIDYKVLNKGEIQVFSEDNGKDTKILRYNKETDDWDSKTLYGVTSADGWEYQEKNGVGLFVNQKTKEERYLFDNNQPSSGMPTGGLIDAFPDGSKGGQCGYFVRQVTGFRMVDPNYAQKGIDPNSFESKMGVVDKSITAETAQPGDVFVMSAGVWTGHTGIIKNKYTDPETGKIMFTVIDSNWNQNEKVMTHQISADKMAGFLRPGLKPEYQWGTDSGSLQDDSRVDISNVAPEVAGYVEQILAGKISLTDVPADERGAVADRMDDPDVKQKANASYIENLNEVIEMAGVIKSHPGLENAVGAMGIGRSGFNPGQNADFVSRVENLTSEETINALISAKARGATFGALSEGELNLLKDAANRINQWAVVDKTGKVKGYKTSNEYFRQALDEVVESTNKILAKIQQVDSSAIDQKTATYLDALNY